MLTCETNSFPTKMLGRGACANRYVFRGQALASLVSSDLGEGFYSWRGASGSRYVCSIFSGGDEAIIAGFSEGVVIGVRRDGFLLQPICLICAEDFKGEDFKGEGGRAFLSEAAALGATEWHVHFGGGEAALRDLAASLLE